MAEISLKQNLLKKIIKNKGVTPEQCQKLKSLNVHAIQLLYQELCDPDDDLSERGIILEKIREIVTCEQQYQGLVNKDLATAQLRSFLSTLQTQDSDGDDSDGDDSDSDEDYDLIRMRMMMMMMNDK